MIRLLNLNLNQFSFRTRSIDYQIRFSWNPNKPITTRSPFTLKLQPSTPFPSSLRPPWFILLLSATGTGLSLHAYLNSRPSICLQGIPPLSPPPLPPSRSIYERPSLLRRWLALLDRYLLEPLATTQRFLFLLALFLPLLITSPILLLEFVQLGHPSRRRSRKKPRVTERRSTRWWYALLVHAMQCAGPTFIKLAQWAGSRTDLFPSTLCEKFGKLHSNGKPHSMKYTRKIVEQAFGKPFEEIFEAFEEEPLGIGAVAQVYRATLRPDLLPPNYLDPKHIEQKKLLRVSMKEIPTIKPTPSVAIKILHPNVAKIIERDLKLMKFFSHLINLFPGAEWLSFPEEVEMFGQLMKSQIDLRKESQNLMEFEKYFKFRQDINFPRPILNYSSKEVLVEEFIDAIGLKLFLKAGGGPFDHRISDLGLDAFLNMLLIDNFVHADLHPGNIMVKLYKPTPRNPLRTLWRKLTHEPEPEATAEQEAQTIEVVHKLRALARTGPEAWTAELERLDAEGYEPELVFIDSGLITTLSPKNRQNFLELFEAIAAFDGYRAGKLMVERCRTPELVLDEETFALKIQHLALAVKSQTFSLATIKISDVLVAVLHAVREHHVKLEPDFINTILSILLLEGIGRQLNPEMDLFKSALPILRSLGSIESLREGVSTHKIGSLFKV
ncbi:hypothetical protein CROQUDRAFT_717259 [Cronartium quercuum f. sp. fusiforme G11]|uniref:ABC1 atypical kinase-like domain-containing protein n=1 Tax=Cronartium quercuum f. sp. fusiforme G11 TaxID=708437 RepID=A0A9P6NGN1_9BASI|nr:hypothetical protein CROQUDRAFT_717259 [Cronartium quercuum f. sp. fusiforme G11]